MANIIIAAVVGALAGFGAAFVKNTANNHDEVRPGLWNKRFESYIRIWKLMQLIPVWPKNEKLTYKGLYEISRYFQDWYFQDGGILLSTASQEKYYQIQEVITNIRLAHEQSSLDTLASNEDHAAVQSACISFRTAISNELLSAKTLK